MQNESQSKKNFFSAGMDTSSMKKKVAYCETDIGIIYHSNHLLKLLIDLKISWPLRGKINLFMANHKDISEN